MTNFSLSQNCTNFTNFTKFDLTTNIENCRASNFLWNLISMQDFDFNDINNPFSFVFLFYGNSSQKIEVSRFSLFFFSICYAYSIFRLVIDLAVIIYAIRKTMAMKKDPETLKRTENDSDLKTEIKIYIVIVILAVLFEFAMSLHNFIVWRGLQYYTSAQDNFFPPYKKPDRRCNCMYNSALYNWSSDFNKIPEIQAAYYLWTIFEGCGMFVIYFSVMSLSRINRKVKKGWKFLKRISYKCSFFAIFYVVLLICLIFEFDLPIFYKFYNYQVIFFWFVWKIIGFLLIFDRLYSKYWLFQTLQIHKLHNHMKQWDQRLEIAENEDIKEIELYTSKDYLKYQKNYTEVESQESKVIDDLILRFHVEEINRALTESIEASYRDVRAKVEKMTKKIQKSKLKMNWQDYLNYFLGLNLLGGIGYFFLLIDILYLETKNKGVFDPEVDTVSGFYFVGIFFCYTEIIIFDLTHGIILLHCFFVELVDFLNRYQKYFENKKQIIDESRSA